MGVAICEPEVAEHLRWTIAYMKKSALWLPFSRSYLLAVRVVGEVFLQLNISVTLRSQSLEKKKKKSKR